MRYKEDTNELRLYSLVRTYDLEWDDPSFEHSVREAVYTELHYREAMEEYEECAELMQFRKWLDTRLG